VRGDVRELHRAPEYDRALFQRVARMEPHGGVIRGKAVPWDSRDTSCSGVEVFASMP
jgi:hypothetical protein